MTLFIATDHAGLRVKKQLIAYFDKKHISYTDLGPHILDTTDDYPDYAVKVAKKVAANKKNKGILICGSGSGMAIAANKVKGVRAAVGYDVYSAKMARYDNDANILTVRSRNFPFSKIKKLVDVWLSAPFSNLKRHKRRLAKVKRI
jgi:ribose 5-phosphate isomerase B